MSGHCGHLGTCEEFASSKTVQKTLFTSQQKPKIQGNHRSMTLPKSTGEFSRQHNSPQAIHLAGQCHCKDCLTSVTGTVASAAATVLLQQAAKWTSGKPWHQTPQRGSSCSPHSGSLEVPLVLAPNSQPCNWEQLQVLSQLILVDRDQNYCMSHYGLNWTDSTSNWEPNQFPVYNRVGKMGSAGIMTASEWVTHFGSFATAFKCHNKIEDIDISPRAHRKFLVSNYHRVKLKVVSAVNSIWHFLPFRLAFNCSWKWTGINFQNLLYFIYFIFWLVHRKCT